MKMKRLDMAGSIICTIGLLTKYYSELFNLIFELIPLKNWL